MDRGLRKAADEGDVKSLQELVAVKADVIYYTTRNEKNTALHIAASKGHTLFVHHFLLYMGMVGELMVSQNIDGDTPMHLVVKAGHLEVVEHLLQYLAWARGIDAKFQDPTMMANKEGNTPLHDALLHRKLEVALKLLEANPRCAHALNAKKQSPLYFAAREGLVHVVKEIASQALSKASVSTFGTAVHQAVLHDSIRALEILLENIMELAEMTDLLGNNVLHYAAQYNRAHMVSMLHKKIPTLAYQKNMEQHTPLHVAATYGSVEFTTELLKQSPDTIGMVDMMGRNAFHIACINGKVKVLELLLKCEVPDEILNQQDRDGNTPLHHAAKLCQRQPIWWLLTDPRINLLVINKDGHTAWAYQIPTDLLASIPRLFMDQELRNAIYRGDVLSLVYFLATHPDMVYSMTLNERNTALHLAASEGNDWIVHHVLFYTNLNVGIIASENVDQDTPLHLAARAGHLEVVHHLIRYMEWAREKEANLKDPTMMANKEGNTPLHDALLHRKLDVALKLLEANPRCAHALNAEKQSPLYFAAREGFVHVVKEIASQALSKASVSTFGTAVHQAVLHDSIRALEILLENIMDLAEMTDLLGNNVMHYAAQYNRAHMVSVLHKKIPILAYKKNMEQHTPLHVAATYGWIEFTTELLKQSPATIGMVDMMGRNAFHIAAIKDKVKVLELLLKCEVPDVILNQQDRDGNTPLHHAAKLCQGQPILLLLTDPRINPLVINKDGHTAWAYQIPTDLLASIPRLLMDQELRNAIYKGDVLSLVYFLATHPDMVYSMTLKERNTALHLAASERNDWIVHHVLFYTNLNVGIIASENVDQDTPLHLAARAGHLEVVQHLIRYMEWAREKEANLKDPTMMANKDGNTPLHDALLHRNLNVALKLLEANPKCAHALNAKNQSPLYFAAKEGFVLVVKEIASQALSKASVSTVGTAVHLAVLHDSIRALEILLENIMELAEMTDLSGNNVLHYAAEYNRAHMVSMLHKKIPTLAYQKNMEQHTPLHVAATYGSIEFTTELLKQSPDTIGMVDMMGRNAFHIACINSKVKVLELLLKCEVPDEILNQQDRDGNTPLHHAAKLCQRQPIWWLLTDPRINPLVINKDGHTAWAYQIPTDLLASVPRLLMDEELPNAIYRGDLLSLVYFLATHPDMVYSMTLKERNTVLHLAASERNDWIVHHVLFYTNMNVGIIASENVDQDTPLHLAARAGHLEVVHHLICYVEWAREKEANLKDPTMMANKEGNTPLHDALLHRKLDVALKILEANPRCAHALNAKKQSPLYVAARDGFVHVVKEIASQALSKASVSTVGTAVHQAVLHDSIRALDILLENIMELAEMTDLSGNNVLHYAAEYNRAHMVSMLHKKIPTLAYKKNIELHTPLHVAATYGSVEFTTEVLKESPDTIGMLDMMGRNAFHIAAIKDKVKVLELLLKCEVPDEILNQQDRDGNTPLHHAAKLCQRQPIWWLLTDPRINPLVINKDGHTAWAYPIPADLLASIPRVLMDEEIPNAIYRGDVLSLVYFLATHPDMVYSMTPKKRNTALHLAASERNDWIVHHVLFYTNLNVGIIASENVDQDTPLHLAARAGHLEVVHHLIRYMEWAREKEANLKEPLTMQNKEGNTPLHEAVVHGRYHVAVELLEGAMEVLLIGRNNIKEYDKYVTVYDMLLVMRNGNGDTPLHLAVKVGDLKLVNKLIKYAKVMNRGLTTQYTEGPMIMGNKKDNTPLHEAVLLRKSDIALKLLEANPKCGHMLNATMLSPLYITVRYGLTHVVKKIASQGLSVASINTAHGTALHQSVLANNIRSLEILLDTYVELVELTDSSGSTALHCAAQTNNARMVSMLLRKESTLAYKQNDEQHTPLCVAVNYGSAKAAKELLKQFPDAIEMVDIMGRNALHIAVIKDQVNMLELLLKYVLPEEIVNQQDIDGNTPLHHAARLYRRQSALVLLDDPRVDPSRINRDGDTAFALCGNQMNLWKELKVHKSRRCKQDQGVTLAGVLDRISLKMRAIRFKFAHDQVTTVDEDLGTYLLVAVLVATLMSMVSFSVTFTMPGGYSRQSGTAIAGRHIAFKLFAVCNTITMCGSIVPVLCFLSQACCFPKDAVNKGKPSMLIWADRLIFLSGITMIMSMLIAVYLTIAPASWWVVSVVLAIGASTPFMLCLILGKSILPTNW